jgi:hypothetical protein
VLLEGPHEAGLAGEDRPEVALERGVGEASPAVLGKARGDDAPRADRQRRGAAAPNVVAMPLAATSARVERAS